MKQSTLLALAAVFLTTPQANAWYPYSDKYNRWQAERPFLMAGLHNSVPKDKLDLRISRFRDAGLNTFIWAKPWNAMEYFREAHRQGIEWACWGRDNPDAVVEAMKIPGNSFVMSGDEPSGREKFEKHVRMSEWVRRTYPDTIQFINLSITKIDHDEMVAKCGPDVFSFDHYPLARDGTTHKHYLFDLDWGRHTAMQYRLPYWIYLQSYGRVEEKRDYAYRNPDEADMRFLVYTFLAHGGTGIQFFMYYGYEESMVLDTGVGRQGDSDGPTKYEHTVRTRCWHAVRDVAPEVQNLGRVLVNLRTSGRIGYVGNGELWDHPHPTYKFGPKEPLNHGPFKRHELLKEAEITHGTDRGLLIAFFDDEAGEEYFMVVNMMHGPNMSKMDGARPVRMRFAKSVEKVERLNRHSGRVEVLDTAPAGDAYRDLKLIFEGGTGELFKWSNGKPWATRE
ncbi:MAG: hypothetical protein CMJ18_08360 [Phycisphaeraceae bacterium]|nr:hypothetical protein [Phycisphaeraceae bacterium]